MLLSYWDVFLKILFCLLVGQAVTSHLRMHLPDCDVFFEEVSLFLVSNVSSSKMQSMHAQRKCKYAFRLEVDLTVCDA